MNKEFIINEFFLLFLIVKSGEFKIFCNSITFNLVSSAVLFSQIGGSGINGILSVNWPMAFPSEELRIADDFEVKKLHLSNHVF
jgi:hypothetical protein